MLATCTVEWIIRVIVICLQSNCNDIKRMALKINKKKTVKYTKRLLSRSGKSFVHFDRRTLYDNFRWAKIH